MRKDFILKFIRHSQNWKSLNVNGAGRNLSRESCLESDKDNVKFVAKAQNMYQQSGSNLLNEPRENVKQWLDSFDAVITDCDGVLWHDDECIPNVPEVFNKLQDTYGKLVICVTNNGTKTRHEIWQRAIKMGFNIQEKTQIIAPTYSIAQYLKLNHEEMFKSKKVYVIGMESVGKELDAFGINHFGVGPDIVNSISDIEHAAESMCANVQVGAVIVAFDDHFSYGKILKAANYLSSKHNGSYDCLFLTTNSDAVHKYPNYHIPGTGAILAAIETSAGRQAFQLGKPNPVICEDLIRRGVIKPTRTLMIGDSCKIDVKFGKNCGFQTLLVGTGQDNWDTIAQMVNNPSKNSDYLPDFYLPSLGDLLDYL